MEQRVKLKKCGEDYAPVSLCPSTVLHIYPRLNPRLCREKLASGALTEHVD